MIVATWPRRPRSIAVEQWMERVITTLRQQRQTICLCQTSTTVFGKVGITRTGNMHDIKEATGIEQSFQAADMYFCDQKKMNIQHAKSTGFFA